MLTTSTLTPARHSMLNISVTASVHLPALEAVRLCQQKKDIRARLCDEAPSAICVELRPKKLEKEVLRALPLPM